MAPHRRKNPIARRRRVEDEGDDEASPYVADLDDDSLSDSTLGDEGSADASDAEHDKAAPAVSSDPQKNGLNGHAPASNGKTKPARTPAPPLANGTNDTDFMLNGRQASNEHENAETVNFEDVQEDPKAPPAVKEPVSTAQMDMLQQPPYERRRREHEEYKKRRDADPAFVPNRGAFFMHDHRHAGPSANGFRPFGRGRGRGRGVGGPFSPANGHFQQYLEPTDAPWTHDMHETVLQEPTPKDRSTVNCQADPNDSAQTTASPDDGPANRSLSTTKHIGNVQIRVFLQGMEKPIVFPGVPVKQYTRLPDRRPPLRRDKPVRISLPNHSPRYIFPAIDRSFIFIPRAMRPNQQGFGGRSNRGRSVLGSVGGYSRRTSMYGGSVYGSAYTPSIAMSRRSSLAHEISRDNIISPTGSVMSRPPVPMDGPRPVVRLPPTQGPAPIMPSGEPTGPVDDAQRIQSYPLPQKPQYREHRSSGIPMHQPRPQKAVSVADIESPASMHFHAPQNPQQPFHQQVPPQVSGNGYIHESLNAHSRQASYPSQASTGTPLSHIPERAIHAQPFQPNPYQGQYYPQSYQMVPQQPGYFYPPAYNPAMAPAGSQPFVATQAPPTTSYSQSGQPDSAAAAAAAAAAGQPGLVAQEVNGMVYYYDASQLPTMTTYPAYSAPPTYPMQQAGGVVGMGGMMTPSPDGFYYPQATQGVVYYPQ